MLRMTEPSISIVKSVSRAVNAHVNAHWQKWFTRAASSVVDLGALELVGIIDVDGLPFGEEINGGDGGFAVAIAGLLSAAKGQMRFRPKDRKSTRLNSSHGYISYAVFCLKKKNNENRITYTW